MAVPSPLSTRWMDAEVSDTTPPDTLIDNAPSDPSNLGSPSFTFSSTEAGSTFECRVERRLRCCPAIEVECWPTPNVGAGRREQVFADFREAADHRGHRIPIGEAMCSSILGFGVRDRDDAFVLIDPFPLEGHRLSSAQAGQHQQGHNGAKWVAKDQTSFVNSGELAWCKNPFARVGAGGEGEVRKRIRSNIIVPLSPLKEHLGGYECVVLLRGRT